MTNDKTTLRKQIGQRYHKSEGLGANQLVPHLDVVIDADVAEPDITLTVLAAALSETQGVQVQLSSLHRAGERAGVSHEKG